MKASTIVAGGILAAGSVLPVIPQQEILQFTVQYPVADQAKVIALNQKDDPTYTQPQFTDIDGSGMITVAHFAKRYGGRDFKQVQAADYQKITGKDGYAFNPTNIEMVSALGLATQVAHAAIAWDTAANVVSGTAGTSVSGSFTTGTLTNGIMAIGIMTDGSSSDLVSSSDYNGTAAVRIAGASQADATSNFFQYSYYVLSPASGAHNITVNTSSSITIRFMASTYSGASQTGQPDASTKNTPASGASSVTLSVTTTADNSWVIGYLADSNCRVVQGTGVTNRATNTGVSPNYCQGMGDSNGPKTPAGSYSMTWNTTSGTDRFVLGMWSIAPAAAAATSQFIIPDIF